VSAVVVSDATPLNYLVLVNAVELLPRLFSAVFIPPAVAAELSSESAPAAVMALMRTPPPWLKIISPKHVDHSLGLDAGETEAIALALELGIKPILIDERKGRRIATQHGLLTLGTLAVLEQSAARGWIDFDEHIARLRNTKFSTSRATGYRSA
jgi:predicted nucleic acid-binding protein